MAQPKRPDSERLLDIIGMQTEVAQLGQDVGAIMALVTQRAQQLTGAGGAVLELAEGEDMVYRAASGFIGNSLGLRLNRANSISGLCVAQGLPLRCDDSESDPRVDREACRRVGLRSLIVAPLTHLDHVVGVLKVVSAEPNGFGDEQLQILALACGVVASAMFHGSRSGDAELFHRATHDPLTGLANRALFYDRLRQRLSQAQRNGEGFGVLNLDMDGLKSVNDVYGHRAGDAVIKEFAGRLHDVSRREDTVARMGGDEFGVVLSQTCDAGQVAQLRRRIQARLLEPFSFERRQLPLVASMGCALFPQDGASLEALLEKADQAMYADKRERKAQRPF